MSGDDLQEAAQNGVFEQTAEIQMAGHPEWKLANMIRGLSFNITEIDLEEEPVEHDEEDRLTRFGTLRELMAAFIRQEVEVDFESNGTFLKVNLCAIATDHFEIIDDDGRERTFIPLHRVRSIVAVDTGNHGTNYRENHVLRISLV